MATTRKKVSAKSKSRKTAKSRKPARKSKSTKTKSTSKHKKAAAKARSKTQQSSKKSQKGSTKSSKAAAKSTNAMRLTFSYAGDDVKLISQQPVDIVVPPSDPLKGFNKQKGFWAELKNAKDKTLYRRVMHNPTRNDAEVFSDDPEQSISREPAPKRKGVFVVVVPDSDKGDSVTLSRSEPETRGPARGVRALASKPASEILRFKLKK